MKVFKVGFTRKVDHLGRLVLPAEVRRTFDIPAGTSIEFLVDDDKLVLRKYVPGCALCGDVDDEMVFVRGKKLCRACAREVLRVYDSQ